MDTTRKMEWPEVKLKLAELEVPQDGDGWERWFENAWRVITDKGLAEYDGLTGSLNPRFCNGLFSPFLLCIDDRYSWCHP